MSSNVSICTKIYETSQSVTINCINTLIENKKLIETLPFSCAQDPNPVKFRLTLDFGNQDEDEEWLSVFLDNLSDRKVVVKMRKLECFTFNNVKLEGFVLPERCYDEAGLEGSSWGYRRFLRLSDLKDVQNNSLNFKCKVRYESEIEQTEHVFGNLGGSSLKNLSDDLLNMLINEKDTDISFEVGPEIIKAHRNILSARCDYFNSMFHSKMIENDSEKVQIKECDPTMFRTILEFLYSDKPPTDIDALALKLLPVADRFMIDPLKHHCAKSLSNNLCPDNIKEVLLLAHRHNCLSLKDFCFHKLTLDKCNDLVPCHADLALEYLQFLSNHSKS